MHNLSVRAFRSAALGLQTVPLATRPGRLFHASTRLRAADDSSSTPKGDGSKPENEIQTPEDGKADDENLFATTDGSHGRKKGGNGLRLRMTRNHKPEELPLVIIPQSFVSKAVCRLEDINVSAKLSVIDERDARTFLENALLHPKAYFKFEEHITYILEAAAWTEETLSETLRALQSSIGFDEEFIHKKGDILVAAAFWAVIKSAHAIHGLKAVDELFEHNSISSSGHLFTALNYTRLLGNKRQTPHPSQARDIIQHVVDHSGLQEHPVSWFSPDLVSEVTAYVRADLLVKAPKNTKLSELRRPITLINFSDYSGYSVPHDVVRSIAHRLESDVLHLRAVDIAHIVGDYLGQDAVRAPGEISQLGYKAAINSGRQPKKEDLLDALVQKHISAISVAVTEDTGTKDNKKSLMDGFLYVSNRGKSESLWNDLKINTALEGLIQCADSESTEQRPLIVHIDDFNALNVDLRCRPSIIDRLRKIIDGLWTDGRQIALVGSCSTKRAPSSYLASLRELESTERVVNLSMVSPSDTYASSRADSAVKWAASDIKRDALEKKDYIKENEVNITKVLSTMVEYPSDTADAAIATTGEIGLSGLHRIRLPKSWTSSILPLNEVYRIATMMIGRLESTNPLDVFSIKSVEKVVSAINMLEEDRTSKENEAKNLWNRLTPGGLHSPPNLFGSAENDHEARLESSLIKTQDIRTTFDDIHASKETIESIKMLTTLSLLRPEAFSYGVLATERIPGCLLYGPPGTGKTLLAKAVAKESGANMIEISGATINNKFVGESEKSVRALFQLAKKKEPLVIFIDEADALLGSRGHGEVLGNVSRRETINQFLREWDGMDKMKAFIMVATNRPFDLDEAVLRRLPRKLLIDLPTEADRAAILKIHLKGEELDPETVSIEDIAKRTPLYSGSDLKNVCVAAAMAAVKEQLELEEQLKTGQRTGTDDGMKRRVLQARHFDKALREIAASVNEDMATLTAIRKFDDKYGDGGASRRRSRKGMGFQIVPEGTGVGEGRIRSGR
ncbi:AAA-domain-containing protein [Annulohypoxylon maeteangense]|uniref:AAA-domain-containing protein n=1 Tax=Annulohypoxylon maeteangense TaxID=1927788 RepID=UPI0020071F5C|nr:AAA-domain-containing protein [Annulohypoxylon maeteangense]KAI0884886.1 AAA-domain-containing protein [Annulohypoxylon maeteangense]